MGNSCSRYFATACAALLSVAAQAQEISAAELASAPADLQLTYCAMKNVEKLANSKESAEVVAIAAISLCPTEKSRLLAENRNSIAQWDYHRRSLIDRLTGMIVQRRLVMPAK